MSTLFTLHEQSDTYVRLQKKIKEVDITVEVSTEFRPDLQPHTTIDILDHFVSTLSWGLGMSLGCSVEVGKWRSTHTIAEDLGQTFGAALKHLFYRKMVAEGINACGSAVFGLDEALARAMVALEGRRNSFITFAEDCPGGRSEFVEETRSADCVALIEGFAQGFPATIHVDALKGRDPHHVWESNFMALGEALKMAYGTNPWKIAKNNPYYGEEGVADASLA
jgi:imidazoleglycerol-phosphate dehydratase